MRSGSSTLDAVDPDHVHVERARPPVHDPLAAGRRLEGAGHREQLAGRALGLELHHHVQVGALAVRPADRVGLVDAASTPTTSGRPATAARR